jgi:hypothetical protein
MAEGPAPEEELMDFDSLEAPPEVIFEEFEPELAMEVVSESAVKENC